MRFPLGALLALALTGQSAAQTLEVVLPPPAVVPTLEPGVKVKDVSLTRLAAAVNLVRHDLPYRLALIADSRDSDKRSDF